MNKKYTSLALLLAATGLVAVAIPTFAATTTPGNRPTRPNNAGMMRGGEKAIKPTIAGKVTAISGNIITITGRQGLALGFKNASTTPKTTPASVTYAVDATNAVIMKNNATSSISSIAVGDMIMVQGTITGTNIIAVNIRDGVVNNGQGKIMENKDKERNASSTPLLQGNGQPVIAGTISAINGSVLTVTNRSNVTYSVDVISAKIMQGQNIITKLNLAVGDSVIIQGTVNGTSIVASSVVDQAKSTNTTSNSEQKPKVGFFGKIGGFFKHMFGF